MVASGFSEDPVLVHYKDYGFAAVLPKPFDNIQITQVLAKLLNVTPAEIFFTSGGTEADNMAINQSIVTYDIKHVIDKSLDYDRFIRTMRE